MGCEVVSASELLSTDFEPTVLRLFADRCASLLARSDADWCVVLADDAFLTDLNTEFRGIEAPTDVLSFPQAEFPDGPNVGDLSVLGDVVISVDTARRQATEQGHSLGTELEVLLVHGLCHLLGWDHVDPSDATAMVAVEQRVLKAVGGGMGLVQRSAT